MTSNNSLEDVCEFEVEVIVCTYNGEKYISEQLESIVSQKYRPDLISVYDDDSSDGTVSIINDFINANNNNDIIIRLIINKNNIGYVENFSQGIRRSSGKILFFSDQDDRWHPEKIQELLRIINNSEVDLVFSNGYLIDANGRMIEKKDVLHHYGLSASDILNFPSQAVSRLARKNYINGASMAVRRGVAISALPVPYGIPHDYWIAIWCALHSGVSVSPRCLYYYRQHANNLIGVGLHKWRHVIYWIIVSPRGPRLIEYARYVNFVPRLDSFSRASIFREKLIWLEDCVVKEGRINRLFSICRSLFVGKYLRFGSGYDLLRDMVSIFSLKKCN